MANRPKLKDLAYVLASYSNSTIPQTYINELSDYELLLTILNKINEIIERCNQYDAAINEVIDYLGTLDEKVIEYLDDLKESGYIAEQVKIATSNKRILLIGDSYLYGAELSSPETLNYGYLLQYQGFDVVRRYSNGGGFTATGDNGKFIDIIENYNDTEKTPESFTDIYFLEGTNDAYSNLGSLKNNIIQTISRARAKFVNAKCHIGYISQLRRSDCNPLLAKSCITIYKQSCLEAKCCYINNSETMLKNPDYIGPDGIHPTVAGQRQIANYLTSYILNGNISTSEIQGSLTFIPADTVQETNGMAGNIYQNNNMVVLTNLQSTAIVFKNGGVPFEMTGLNAFYIGQISNCLIWGQSATTSIQSSVACTVGGTLAWNSDAAADPSTDVIVPCSFRLSFIGQSVFLSPLLLYNRGTYLGEFIRQVNLEPFTLIANAQDC